jgi:hypothetical protein
LENSRRVIIAFPPRRMLPVAVAATGPKVFMLPNSTCPDNGFPDPPVVFVDSLLWAVGVRSATDSPAYSFAVSVTSRSFRNVQRMEFPKLRHAPRQRRFAE